MSTEGDPKVSIRIPENYLDQIDNLIYLGDYGSRSHYIRSLIKRDLIDHGLLDRGDSVKREMLEPIITLATKLGTDYLHFWPTQRLKHAYSRVYRIGTNVVIDQSVPLSIITPFWEYAMKRIILLEINRRILEELCKENQEFVIRIAIVAAVIRDLKFKRLEMSNSQILHEVALNIRHTNDLCKFVRDNFWNAFNLSMKDEDKPSVDQIEFIFKELLDFGIFKTDTATYQRDSSDETINEEFIVEVDGKLNFLEKLPNNDYILTSSINSVPQYEEPFLFAFDTLISDQSFFLIKLIVKLWPDLSNDRKVYWFVRSYLWWIDFPNDLETIWEAGGDQIGITKAEFEQHIDNIPEIHVKNKSGQLIAEWTPIRDYPIYLRLADKVSSFYV